MNQQIALIDLPANFTSNITSSTAALISDFSGPITLILGILLLATVVGIFISSLRRH